MGHCSEMKTRPITSFILGELHWLPVIQKIHIKQCMLDYKSLDDKDCYLLTYLLILQYVVKSFESESYQLQSAVRGELVLKKAIVEVSSTLVHFYEKHSHLTFKTRAFHFTSLEMNLKLYIS